MMLPEIEAIDYVAPAPMDPLEGTGKGITPEAVHYFSKGITLSEQGRYREAVDAYGQGLKHANAVPQAWYNKGTALGELERYEEAVAALDQAVFFETRLLRCVAQQRGGLRATGKAPGCTGSIRTDPGSEV